MCVSPAFGLCLPAPTAQLADPARPSAPLPLQVATARDPPRCRRPATVSPGRQAASSSTPRRAPSAPSAQPRRCTRSWAAFSRSSSPPASRPCSCATTPPMSCMQSSAILKTSGACSRREPLPPRPCFWHPTGILNRQAPAHTSVRARTPHAHMHAHPCAHARPLARARTHLCTHIRNCTHAYPLQ